MESLLPAELDCVKCNPISHPSSFDADELRFRTVIDNIADGVITLDAEGVIQSFNPAASRIFGYERSEIVGHNIQRLMPPEMRSKHVAGMARLKSGAPRRIAGGPPVELPGLHRDGSVFQLELAINPMRIDGSTSYVGIVRDISERRRAADELYAEKERLRVTLSSIVDAVISTDSCGRITYLNPMAETMTGWQAADAIGAPLDQVFALVDAQGRPAALSALQRVRQRQELDGVKRAAFLAQAGGAVLPVEESCAPLHGAGGDQAGVVLVFHDVSQTRALTDELSHQAAHDALTGLINRREFERRLVASMQPDSPQGLRHTLLYLDLDQFKIVNDTCGHASGDELLRQLSMLMAARLRGSDSLARLGGDEFGVLLESCLIEDALRIADDLRKVVSEFRYRCQDKVFQVSVSIGLAAFAANSASMDDVLRRADAACYVAKDKGRNRLHVHTPEDRELAERRGQMGWLARIRSALDENRLVLHAQRMRGLADKDGGGSLHYELLVRMIGEQGELIPPDAFIPAAERYGMMHLVDRWVIQHAFAEYRDRSARHQPPVHYAINLSAGSICDASFLPFVLEQFALYPVPPACICFEITESQAIANLSEATALILKLKEIGCRFALDDFGIGMASFSYLKNLPVDYLKIDGSFVRGMVGDQTDRAMVEAINHVGHVMKIQTIAECAETDDIMQVLGEIGVDFAQGYAIERPALW